MSPPFFENRPGPGGREDPQEDLYTFHKCRQAGFQPIVDLDCTIGHCFPGVVTPQYDPHQQQWGVHVWSHTSLGVLWPNQVRAVDPDIPQSSSAEVAYGAHA